MPSNEVNRIKAIYRSYQNSDDIQAKWSQDNIGNQAIVQERKKTIRRLLNDNELFALNDLRILDVGCGDGSKLASLQGWGAQPENLYGVDLLDDRIVQARRRYPSLNFRCENAEHLSFSGESFHLVLLFTVLSSILDQGMTFSVASEAQRVLKPGGVVIWYDFRYNNPQNQNVRGIKKKEIQTLFSGYEINLKTITLLPFLARRLGKLTSFLYPLFSILPWLRTHYVGLFQKPNRMKNNAT